MFDIGELHESFSIETISDEISNNNENTIKNEKEENTIEFLNSITKTLEKNLPRTSTTYAIPENQDYNVLDMANAMKLFFEGRMDCTFEWYQRAGKFFFHCEHNLDENRSKILRDTFEYIVEKKMAKTDIHYITKPNYASVIFR